MIVFVIYIVLYHILTLLDYYNIFPTDMIGRHVLCFMGIIIAGGSTVLYIEYFDDK